MILELCVAAFAALSAKHQGAVSVTKVGDGVQLVVMADNVIIAIEEAAVDKSKRPKDCIPLKQCQGSDTTFTLLHCGVIDPVEAAK